MKMPCSTGGQSPAIGMGFGCFLDSDSGICFLWNVVAELSLEFSFRSGIFSQSRFAGSELGQLLVLFFLMERVCSLYNL